MFKLHPEEGLRKLLYSADSNPAVESGMFMMEDPKTLKKQASESLFGCSWDSLKPDKDHVAIHVVALGDTEHYLVNRNSDGFSKQSCINRHHTFVTNGKIYKNHDNKDPDKALGAVIKSAYNEPMGRIELVIHAHKEKARDQLQKMAKEGEHAFSMSCTLPFDVCVTKGTLITTENSGMLPIESVKVGEKVLTHQGNFKPVLTTHINNYSGGLTTIKPNFLPSITFTDNHPIFIVPKEVLHYNYGRRIRLESPDGTVCTYGDKGFSLGSISNHIKMVQASDVREGDFVLTPNYMADNDTKSRFSDKDLAFAYVAGFYAGDGCIIKQRRGGKKRGDIYTLGVRFSVGIDKLSISNLISVLGAVNSSSNTIKIYKEKNKNALVISLHDRQLAYKLLAACGEYSHTKFVNLSAFKTKEERLAFMGGYIDSDGSIDRKKHSIRTCSVSKTLGYGVSSLLSSIGVISALSLNKLNKYPASYIGASSHFYQVHIGAFYLELFSKYSYKAASINNAVKIRSRTNSMIWNNYILSPVTSITRTIDTTTVYNLTVQDDETYVAGGISTHNCSICGSARKSLSDPNQCDHVRNELGHMRKDGSYVYVDNPNPTFFDISFVNRPADRIAWNLKMASCEIPSSVKQAEDANLLVPDYLECSLSSTYKSKLDLLNKLAAYEDYYMGVANNQGTTSKPLYYYELIKAASTNITDKDLYDLRSYNPTEIFTELAHRNIVLPATLFFKYACGENYGELKDIMPGILKVVKSGLYSRLLKSAEHQRVCRNVYFDVDTNPLSGYIYRRNNELAKQARERFNGCGFSRQEIENRILDVTIAGKQMMFDTTVLEKAAECSVEYVKGAECYASYVLSALDAINKSNGDDSIIALTAVQNLVK